MRRVASCVAAAVFVGAIVACSSSSSSGPSAAGCDPAKVYTHASVVDPNWSLTCPFNNQPVGCDSTQSVGFAVTLSCGGAVTYKMVCTEVAESVQRGCTCTTPSGSNTTTRTPPSCTSCPGNAAGAVAIAISDCGFPADTATNPTIDPP